jgi:hypothetical protein
MLLRSSAAMSVLLSGVKASASACLAHSRGHALLSVKEEFHDPGRKRRVAAMGGGFRFGGPNQKPTHRVSSVERIEEPTNLVSIPDVTSLEFGQRHVPIINVVEDS